MRSLMLAHGRTIAAFVFVAVCALLSFRALRPKPVPAEMQPSLAWGSTKELQAEIARTPTIDPLDAGGVRALVEGSVEPPSGSASLPRGAEEALVDVLCRYIDALTAENSERYLALANSEPTRWIGQTDANWGRIDFAHDHFFQTPADRHDPSGTLGKLLDQWRFGEGRRFRRLGTGKHGLRIIIERARTEMDLLIPLVFERDGRAEAEYWNHGGRHGIRFREPARTVGDILRAHHAVHYAQAMVLFRTENDTECRWLSTWYWDHDSSRWLNSQSEVESFSGQAICY